MFKVKVQDLKKGMIPVKDIKDQTGRVLFATGTELTEKKISTLKAWGITDVLVEGDQGDKADLSNGDDVNPHVIRRIEKDASELFRYADGRHPAVRELINLYKMRKMERASEKEAN